MTRISAPFSLGNPADRWMRAVKVTGLATLTDEGLILEFTVRENFSAPQLRTCQVPWEAIESIVYKRHLLSDSMEIRVNTLSAFNGLSSDPPDTCVLRFDRSARDRSRDLNSDVQLAVAELQLRRLGASEDIL